LPASAISPKTKSLSQNRLILKWVRPRIAMFPRRVSVELETWFEEVEADRASIDDVRVDGGFSP